MSTRDGTWIAIGDLTGGLNTADPPMTLPANQLVEAQNVEFYRSSCGRKRAGTITVTTTGGPAGGFNRLIRHLPGADETTAELWTFEAAQSARIYRLAAGTAWSLLTLADVANVNELRQQGGASFNGKHFIAYDSSVDRLHVWDGTSVRRVGLATPAAPTAANPGGGGAGYPAILRYYKVSYIELSGTTVVRRSELSPSLSFTPSGADNALTVTKPAAISEGETHWEVWGSADNVTFFLLFQTVVGTTTVSDQTLPSNYGNSFNGNASLGNAQIGTIAPLVGENVPPGSAKYLLVDEDRLLMAGNWEESAKNSIVEFTPVGGDKDIGDDERVPATSQRKLRLNVDRRSGGAITGMARAFSTPFVFKYARIYKLVRTGNSTQPYTPLIVSDKNGAIYWQGIVSAEDEAGQEALYFFDRTGPYRVTQNGVEFCGRDLLNIWRTVNLAADVPVIAIYYADQKQVWWYIATGSNTIPNALYIFDVRAGRRTNEGIRGGWSQYTLPQAVQSAVMFSNTIGATMSRDLKPYKGPTGSVALTKCDSGLDDSGTDFQGIVTTKPFPLVGSESGGLAIGVKGGVTGVVIEAEASLSSVDIALHRDYQIEQRPPKTVSLVPVGLETRVIRQVTDLELTEAQLVQVKFGDASALESTWNVDRIGLKLRRESDSL